MYRNLNEKEMESLSDFSLREKKIIKHFFPFIPFLGREQNFPGALFVYLFVFFFIIFSLSLGKRHVPKRNPLTVVHVRALDICNYIHGSPPCCCRVVARSLLSYIHTYIYCTYTFFFAFWQPNNCRCWCARRKHATPHLQIDLATADILCEMYANKWGATKWADFFFPYL